MYLVVSHMCVVLADYTVSENLAVKAPALCLKHLPEISVSVILF